MAKTIRFCILGFASGFGTGFFPVASGTVATALAIPLYFLLLHRLNAWGPGLIGYAAVVAALFAAGTMASTEAESHWGEKDPHRVTIDEVVGYFLCLFLVPISEFSVLAAFFLFRLFDVWKPWVIRRSQDLPAGLGIMVDDALAGALTCVLLNVAFRLF